MQRQDLLKREAKLHTKLTNITNETHVQLDKTNMLAIDCGHHSNCTSTNIALQRYKTV